MRVYNLHGRRDNKYKARIKILVHETGVEKLSAEIEAEWAHLKDGELKLPEADIAAINAYFAPRELAATRPRLGRAARLEEVRSRFCVPGSVPQRGAAPASRLRHGDDFLEPHRRHSG